MTQQPTDLGITQDDKLWALLSYLFAPLIPIIVMLMDDKKNRPFLKFHAVQALVLILIAYVFYFVLGWILIGFLLGGAVFVYMIVIGIKAFQGETMKAWLIGDWIKKNNWG